MYLSRETVRILADLGDRTARCAIRIEPSYMRSKQAFAYRVFVTNSSILDPQGYEIWIGFTAPENPLAITGV